MADEANRNEELSDRRAAAARRAAHGVSDAMAEGDIDVRRLVLLLWRRRFLILAIMTIFVSLATIFLLKTEERFTARALVMIESVGYTQPELDALLKDMSIDTSLILGEVEVLKSRILARKIIDRLNLVDDPEFSPRARREGREWPGTDAVTAMTKDKASLFRSLNVEEIAPKPVEVADVEISTTVDNFLRRLTVRPVPGSYVIQVFFESKDPRKASLVANAVVDMYIEERLETKFEAMQKVNRWLDARLETLRNQVRTSEAAVEEYRAEHGLLKGIRSELTAQQLTELSSQLVFAKAKLAEAQARMVNIGDWASDTQLLEASVEATSSPMIQELRRREAEIDNQYADLSTRYGDRHPRLIALKAEQDQIATKIDTELHRIARGIKTEVEVAKARVDALLASIDELEFRQQGENQAMIRLRELEREAEATRMIFDTFLDTYKRSDKKEQLQEAEARVISYASVPLYPSYPNRPLFLLLSLVVSLFVGFALSLLLEKLDNAFRSATQIESFTGYPCFGLVPAIRGKNQERVASEIIDKPSSSLAEAMRALRMAINLRSRGERPKVVAITSSFPGEGKTTLSAWLGKLAAKSGEKAIIIDCDLRRPRLHAAFGQDNSISIVEYLTGQAKLEDVIHSDPQSGAHVIFGRAVPGSAIDLLGKAEMETLLSVLRQTYDLVILDSPACLAVADSKLLAKRSDCTLYAVSWNETPREVVATGLKQFVDIGHEKMAFVLTNVDVRRHVKYGYGDTAYYYSHYKEYYSS
ncbi:MAG: hypothetical protein EOM26_00820 [Alphaproteobacteria bacterium]|nr:hypothetical protein [Alphaproteobacteria bacterium]